MISQQYQRLTNTQKTTFTTMTFNILYDTRHQNQKTHFLQKYHIKHSVERFAHIIKKVRQIQPDVITFNEITSLFLNFLNQDEFICRNYTKSTGDFNPKTNYDIEGNLILIKKSFQKISFQKIYLETHNEPVPIGFFHFNKKRIAVASVHLLAFSKNHKKRQYQLQQIVDYFNFESKKNIDLLILQGDMNFHSEQQNKILNEFNLKDAWMQKYDLNQNPGFTFDSQQNNMINELYWGFQRRRMRLDRIFFLQDKKNVRMEVISIDLVLNKPIYNNQQSVNQRFMGFLKGIISFIGDFFSKNWLREKERYLFPSDHFGIFAILKIQ